MTSEQLLQLSRGMSAERLLLLLFIPLVSSQFDRELQIHRGQMKKSDISGYQDLLFAKAGQDVTLPCLGLRVEQKVAFQWIRTDVLDLYIVFNGHQVLFPRNNQEAFRGRLKLSKPSSMKEGDFSLTLQNVNINDEGEYECVIRNINPEGLYVKVTRSITLRVSEGGQRLQGGTSCSHYEKDNDPFIIITVSVSLVCVVLLCIIFLIIRYRKTVRDSKLRSSQRSRELSNSKDQILDF